MEPIKHLIVWYPLALGEFSAGYFDVAGKLDAVEEVVEGFGIHEVRGGASVLRD